MSDFRSAKLRDWHVAKVLSTSKSVEVEHKADIDRDLFPARNFSGRNSRRVVIVGSHVRSRHSS
jgi:hypothetical protein